MGFKWDFIDLIQPSDSPRIVERLVKKVSSSLQKMENLSLFAFKNLVITWNSFLIALKMVLKQFHRFSSTWFEFSKYNRHIKYKSMTCKLHGTFKIFNIDELSTLFHLSRKGWKTFDVLLESYPLKDNENWCHKKRCNALVTWHLAVRRIRCCLLQLNFDHFNLPPSLMRPLLSRNGDNLKIRLRDFRASYFLK